MKQLIDFIPLILFFVVYKMDPRTVEVGANAFELGGPFSATLVLMVTSVIIYGSLFLKNRTLEKAHIVTLVAVVLFGSMTLFFHDEAFLKWKAPIVNWIFAVAFLGSQFIGEKTLLERMMGHALTLPKDIWLKMNISWVVFFLLLGAANLFVAFTFHNIWVDFKVFGSLILTFLFVIGQFLLISKHIQPEEK
ncbi:septation protein A [uncultured Endozoicomonas sp.]|uniref:septation protein A n=1 Tax=uncultured Endozoicomonas sp. TaxID=432652 RepID=UPI002621954A|nr:septation protein A [uncultured Endozoicomonas sp.]